MRFLELIQIFLFISEYFTLHGDKYLLEIRISNHGWLQFECHQAKIYVYYF